MEWVRSLGVEEVSSRYLGCVEVVRNNNFPRVLDLLTVFYHLNAHRRVELVHVLVMDYQWSNLVRDSIPLLLLQLMVSSHQSLLKGFPSCQVWTRVILEVIRQGDGSAMVADHDDMLQGVQ